MSTNELLDSYSKLRREVSRLVFKRLKSMKMGHKQMVILTRLSQGEASMSELAEYSMSDKAAITRMTAAMIKMGWIKRASSKEDRRKYIVELTAKGRQKAALAQRLREEIGKEFDNTLNGSERKQLAQLLSKVSQGLQEAFKE